MKPESIKKIAWTVPTSHEELVSLGVLGENIIKEYGERLLRAINNFVEKEGLSEIISQKQSNKKAKIVSDESAKAGSMSKVYPADEFDMDDLDFNVIEVP
jgi:hypothetical protein